MYSLTACTFQRVITAQVPQQTARWKHSSTQLKRIFHRNPARLRVEKRLGHIPEPKPLPPPQFPPVHKPQMLANGWSAPPSASEQIPDYPFTVERTQNKPNDAVGFLPVYTKFRKDGTKATTRIKKIKGDQEVFIQELRASLQIPYEEPVQVRVGGTVEISGNRARDVREWLAGLGF